MKHFVFLQGMPSPFFRRIAHQLQHRHHRVTGICFSAGDWLFWQGLPKVNYRGRLRHWGLFFRQFCLSNQVTDLVLLGEQRRYHKQAVAIAQELGLRVTVTDFGYLRPDWITLERDGMSANSRFPRNPDIIRQQAAQLPDADLTVKFHDDADAMARGDLLYSFTNVFFWWLWPNYRRSDNRPPSLLYFPVIGLRLLRAKFNRQHANHQMQHILQAPGRLFVFPMQLEHDFQLVAYSPFDSVAEALWVVMRSFADHAKPDDRLVFKVHPWDPGLVHWRREIAHMAAELHLHDRVSYLDGGNLDTLITHSAGMVTVNSTAGLQALRLGSPVVVLGESIYDVPGLTFQHGLDRFWQEACAPDTGLLRDYLALMTASIQIRGVFFAEPGLSAAVDTACLRLLSGLVGEVLTTT